METTTKEFKHVTYTENGVSCELPNNIKPKRSRKCGYTHTCTGYFNKTQKNYGVTLETIDSDLSIMLIARTLEQVSVKLNAFDKNEKVYNFGFEAIDFDRNAELNKPIEAKADATVFKINNNLFAYITKQLKNNVTIEVIKATLLKAQPTKETVINYHIDYIKQQQSLNSDIPEF